MEHLLKWRFTEAQADALVEHSEFLIAINNATTELHDFIVKLIITRSKLVRAGLNLQTSEWRSGVQVTPEMAALRVLLAVTNAQVRHWSVHTRLLHSSWKEFLTPEINHADNILRDLFNIDGAYHLRVYAPPENPGDEGTLAIRAVSSACISAYHNFFSLTGNREVHSVAARFGVNTDDNNDIHSVAGDIDNVTDDDAVTTVAESTIDEDMEEGYHGGDDEKGESGKQGSDNGDHGEGGDNEERNNGKHGSRVVVVEVSDSDSDDDEFEKAVTLMIISLDEKKFDNKDGTGNGGAAGGAGGAGSSGGG